MDILAKVVPWKPETITLSGHMVLLIDFFFHSRVCNNSYEHDSDLRIFM